MIIHILEQLRFFPLTIAISVLLFVACLFYKDNKGKVIERIKEFLIDESLRALFIIYLTLMMTATIIARSTKNPFANIIGYFWYDGWGEFNYVGLLNIIMFIPYTILYILAFRPEKAFKKSFLLSIMTTIIIETYQLLFWVGQFSLADIIHNTIGGIAGYIIWHITTLCIEVIKRRHKK